MYTTVQKYRTSGFKYFVKSGFERQPLVLDKQMIPHFKPLDVGSKISQKQSYSSIRDVCLSTIIACEEINGNVKKCHFFLHKIDIF